MAPRSRRRPRGGPCSHQQRLPPPRRHPPHWGRRALRMRAPRPPPQRIACGSPQGQGHRGGAGQCPQAPPQIPASRSALHRPSTKTASCPQGGGPTDSRQWTRKSSRTRHAERPSRRATRQGAARRYKQPPLQEPARTPARRSRTQLLLFGRRPACGAAGAPHSALRRRMLSASPFRAWPCTLQGRHPKQARSRHRRHRRSH